MNNAIKHTLYILLIFTSLFLISSCGNTPSEKPTENPSEYCSYTPPSTSYQDLKPDKYLELTYLGDKQPVVGQIIELEVKNLSQEYVWFPDGYHLIIAQGNLKEVQFNLIFDLLDDIQQKSFILEPSGSENDLKIMQLLPKLNDIGVDQTLNILVVGQRYIDGKTCKDSYGASIELTLRSTINN